MDKDTFKPTHKTKIDEIGDYHDKVGRGTGVTKPKKGKGSFRRNKKHKNKNKDWE